MSYNTILKWLRKFNIRIRTKNEIWTGKNHPNYGKTGENTSHWKGDDIGYQQIHERAHKVDPKPKDGICRLCNKVIDKFGKTKLIHSNKDHSYRLPINPEEWWWIHESCHQKYDAPKIWTSEKRKEFGEKMKRPEVIEKRLKTIGKNKAKKKAKRLRKFKANKNKSQVAYWLS